MQNKTNQASEYKRSGQFDSAIKIYKTLLKSYPSNGILHKSIGKTYAGMGYFEKALNHFETALSDAINNNDGIESMNCEYLCENMKKFQANGYKTNDSSFIEFIKSIVNSYNFKMPKWKDKK